jgi:PAS domain S-box-containing protein
MLSAVNYGVGKRYSEACSTSQLEGSPLSDQGAAGIENVLAGAETDFLLEYPWHLPDSQRWFRLRATPLSDTSQSGALVSLIDITKERLADELMHRQARMLDQVDSAVVGMDYDGLITYFNRAASELYGRSVNEVRGLGALEVTVAKGKRREAAEIMDHIRQGESWSGEFVGMHSDGREFPAFASIVPLFDEDRVMIGIVSISYDLTDRKAEAKLREELELQLRQSQKMEAVGRLTGGVAHDFNNILTVVLGNLELIKEKVSEDETLVRQTDAAIAAGLRGAELTHRLLAFSRRQTLEPVVVDINQRITDLVPLIERMLGETISVKCRLDESLWPVLVDPGQFESSLVNLAVNARDAMPDGGLLTINTENVVVDEVYAATRFDIDVGDYVRVSVSDSGTGMTPEVKAQAFEPFFTTKDVGKGTGLGLSMVYGFAKQSGGLASIYSEVGMGTTVNILLPTTESHRGALIAEERELQAAATGNGLVLVVEDDAAVRSVAVKFLDQLGYSVIEAANVAEGLEAFRRNDAIELIVTDVILPGGKDGSDLVREAREIRPEIKVLFVSGYTDDVLSHNGRLDAGVTLLRKPFSRRQFADHIRLVMERGSGG